MAFLALVPALAAFTPSAGLGRRVLDAALASPLYKLIIMPQARRTIVRTAEANGIPWRGAVRWLQDQGPWSDQELSDAGEVEVPDYYKQPFHAYEAGNLCWEAAWEAEVASKAVGTRNYPKEGAKGEEAFRGAFDEALESLGASCPEDGFVLDFGCGTGTSSRRLARNHPQARRVLGLDLSPYFIAVGTKLLEIAPTDEKQWISPIDSSMRERVELRRADIGRTGLAEATADVVFIGLVIHELPPYATRAVVAEALRVLRPGGQLWITEMDFESEAYSRMRANPLLFSLVRSTEPYLDEYADYQPKLPQDMVSMGYVNIRIAAATGRHFAMVAEKPASSPPQSSRSRHSEINDRRGATAKVDTHLNTWELKAHE